MASPHFEDDGGPQQGELFPLGDSAPKNAPKKESHVDEFFGKQEPHSAVKSAIVQKYFLPWARIMIRNFREHRVQYLDLYSGPGKYDDGSDSTPLLVLKQIIDNEDLHGRVHTYFSDEDNENVEKLRKAVSELPNVEKVQPPPIIETEKVGPESHRDLSAANLIPTLAFLDPFGYKEISAELIEAILKDYGSECVFFFNYNRISMAIKNPKVRHLVDAIFGKERVDQLKIALEDLDDKGTEIAVLGALREALRERGGTHMLPFRFREGKRTTHHLVFVSKNPLGHKIMKDIMGKASSHSFQGVPTFEFVEGASPIELFEEEPRPIDDLKAQLLETFAGQRLTVQSIFDTHNLGTPYVFANYQEALKQLMAEGRVEEVLQPLKIPLKPPFKHMAKDRIIKFP